jgi:hypothetical protein
METAPPWQVLQFGKPQPIALDGRVPEQVQRQMRFVSPGRMERDADSEVKRRDRAERKSVSESLGSGLTRANAIEPARRAQ